MDKLLLFAGKVAITTIYIEAAFIFHEWYKQAKIETDRKEAIAVAQCSVHMSDNPLDISTELDDVKARLDALELG